MPQNMEQEFSIFTTTILPADLSFLVPVIPAQTALRIQIYQYIIAADSIDHLPWNTVQVFPAAPSEEFGRTAYDKGADPAAGKIQFQVAYISQPDSVPDIDDLF